MSDTTTTSTSTTESPASGLPAPSTSRLFVGNLPYNYTDDDLLKLFAGQGKVTTARIIQKRGVSIGYGFVDMEDEPAAQAAIAALNKTDISGRAINVELTKERAPVDETKPAKRGSARRRSGKPKTNGTSDAKASPSTTSPSHAGEDNTTGDKPRRRAANGERNKAAPKPAAPRAPESTEPKQPSADTLFVNNLPYSYDNARFLELFKDYSPKDAHIIISKRFNRSKGFGFVEFNNSADQQKALALDNTELEGRVISVKVAHARDLSAEAETPSAN
ncbi:hypothetical protein SAMD00019534_044390 [Acytostelium subglobosum LB1]|uniref:hypothetical protein n=1 Tax=Acytostelium subglobosum LB1 TaxID=1410327 RepID=UPI000644BA20|nr:hypothetical protein SAMD00019534_044390 [Acytostelium subglobosum LB1]GAM21264.1 hypothetical protein SAMD00019534_044390 [Acytostelium subglobosum LB1]|eukprot:XP_012755383.1 hypothetical protein SAMD00019534_044390 [Acytostelium subglobosum LB1]